MNLIFLCAVRDAPIVPPMIHSLLVMAARRASIDPAEIEVTGALTSSADMGWRAVQAMSSYIDIDAVICFDKTTASFGLPDMLYFNTEYIRLPGRLALSHILRWPGPADPFWTDARNVDVAVYGLQLMLTPAPITAPSPHLAWPSTTWN